MMNIPARSSPQASSRRCLLAIYRRPQTPAPRARAGRGEAPAAPSVGVGVVSWIAPQVVVVLLLFAAFAASSGVTRVDSAGPCVGGPMLGEAVEADENGRAVVPCAISGTTTVRCPSF